MRLTLFAVLTTVKCLSNLEDMPYEELGVVERRGFRDPQYAPRYEPRYAGIYDESYEPHYEPHFGPRFEPRYEPRYGPRYDVYNEQQYNRRPHYYWVPRRGPQFGRPRAGYMAPGFAGSQDQSDDGSSDDSCQSINLVQLVSQLENTADKISDAKDSLERFLTSLRTLRVFEIPREISSAVGFALSITRDTQQAVESLNSNCGHAFMHSAITKAVSGLRDGQQDLIGAVSNLIRNPWAELHNLKADYHNLEEATADTIGSIIKFLMKQRQSRDKDSQNDADGSDSNSSSDSGFAAFTDFSVSSSSTVSATSAGDVPADGAPTDGMPTGEADADAIVAAVVTPGHRNFASKHVMRFSAASSKPERTGVLPSASTASGSVTTILDFAKSASRTKVASEATSEAPSEAPSNTAGEAASAAASETSSKPLFHPASAEMPAPHVSANAEVSAHEQLHLQGMKNRNGQPNWEVHNIEIGGSLWVDGGLGAHPQLSRAVPASQSHSAEYLGASKEGAQSSKASLGATLTQNYAPSRTGEAMHGLLLTGSHGPFAPNSISFVQHHTASAVTVGL